MYVRSYPEPNVKVQVSVGGGQGPVWSADGTRLYYVSGSAIIEARLATSPGLRVFFSSRRRHTRFDCDWSSDVCSSDLTSTPDLSPQLNLRRPDHPPPAHPTGPARENRC